MDIEYGITLTLNLRLLSFLEIETKLVLLGSKFEVILTADFVLFFKTLEDLLFKHVVFLSILFISNRDLS